MGNPEKVEAGSTQHHPSSDDFDSGVDDLLNPKWYIVWTTHMNIHILPEYIVSFKSSLSTSSSSSSSTLNEHQSTTTVSSSRRRAPFMSTVAGMSFENLLSDMGKFLPASMMEALETLYKKHKAGKMSKDIFIRHFRSMVGDMLLASTIKRIRGNYSM